MVKEEKEVQVTKNWEWRVGDEHISVYMLQRLKSPPAGYFPGGAVVKNLPANAGTQVWSLVQEDPTCRGATKPMCHNYWSPHA